MKAFWRLVFHRAPTLALGAGLLISAGSVLGQEERMNRALQDGRTLATERSTDANKGIKAPAEGKGASAVVPHYNDAADGRYQGGKGNPAPAGTQKILDCATATPEQLAGFAGKHCDATNFLTRNSTTRPSVAIGKNDPMLKGAQSKVDLGKQLGLPSGMTSTTKEDPQCETVIKPGGERVETAVCHEEGQAREEKCQVGRVIEVNGEFRYECETQVRRIKQVQCDITYGEECTTAPSTLVCPNGSKPANGVCTTYSENEQPAFVSAYSCPTGYTLSGATCFKTETTSASVSGYSCAPGYTVSGSSCVRTTVETVGATPVLSCPSGSTLSGSNCLSTETVGANISSYSCPAGTTLSGSNCVMTETVAPTTNNTCPSGYTLSGSTCSKTTTSLATPIYSCAAGYSLSGTSCTRQISNPATTSSYTCPSGYTVSGSSCTRTITDTLAGTPIYSCPSGFSLSGSTCSRQLTSAATAVYSCPSGFVLSGTTCVSSTQTLAGMGCPPGATVFNVRNMFYSISSGGFAWMPVPKCSLAITVPATGSGPSNLNAYPAHIVSACRAAYPESTHIGWISVSSRACYGDQGRYICPAGTTRSGSYCVTTTTQSASLNYTCPTGYTLSGATCFRTETTSASVSGYSCAPGYTVSGSSCVRTTVETVGATPVLSCPSGSTLSGSNCLSTETVSANISSYSCPAGTTLSGSNCVMTETIAPTTNNTCPSGYTLSGSTCSKTTTSSATPIYSCAAGYSLSGTSCTRQISNPATTSSYTCPSGYTVSGSSCTRTITDTLAGTPIYSCPSGFSLSGSTCSKTTSNSATPIYSCQPGGTLAGDKCTYVVTTTSDAIEKFSCDDPNARLTAGVLQGGRQTYVCCKETVNNQCGGLEALLK